MIREAELQRRLGTSEKEVPLGSKGLLIVRVEKVMMNNAGNIGRGEITGWSLDLVLKSENY